MSQAAAGTDITAALLNSLPFPLDTLAIGSVTNSTSETTIGTFAVGIPANDASFNSGYRFKITGSWDSTATPTIQLRLYLGSLMTGTRRIFDSGSMTGSGAGTSKAFWLDAFLICTLGGGSGTMDCGGLMTIVNTSTGQPVSSAFTGQTFNTTFTQQLILTAQFGTASASNTARTLSGVMGRL